MLSTILPLLYHTAATIPKTYRRLGNEQERIGVLAFRIDFDLRWQVRLCITFLEHGDRRELGIAQAVLFVGISNALGERAIVRAIGEN